MQCTLFRSLLHQSIESHNDSVSEEVRSHGTTCGDESCREAWDDHVLLSSAISQWKSELPTVDLTDRVMQQLCSPAVSISETSVGQTSVTLKSYFEQSWQDFQAPQQRPWAAALSVAAALLVIVAMIVSLPHSPYAQIAVRQRNNPTIGDSVPQLASHTNEAPDVAVATVEWAQQASLLMADAIVSIPEHSQSLVPGESWEIDWKQKLEPIRKDAHSAWDKLLELSMKKDEG